jgi:hypothetical protein
MLPVLDLDPVLLPARLSLNADCRMAALFGDPN